MFDREFLRERIGSMRQLASIRRAVLDDDKGRGMRVIDVENGSGLAFSVYPDRGMDIGEATFKGIPLAWLTANGPVSPQFYDANGFNWLRSWGGGLLTGCGLMNVGGPNDCGGESHGLHGRLSNTPAGSVNSGAGWKDGDYRLEVSGEVRLSRVFGKNLLLSRRISTAMGDNSITIEDTVENQGFNTTPLMQLYHINLGWPLVDENCYIEAEKHQVKPQNENAAAGFREWEYIQAPTANFVEQVFYHDIPANADGIASARLVNPKLKLAVRISYRVAELPYLVQWKQCGRGEYVCGLEPANCYPEGQSAMIEKNMLKTLAPDEKVSTWVNIALEEL